MSVAISHFNLKKTIRKIATVVSLLRNDDLFILQLTKIISKFVIAIALVADIF